MRNQLIYSIGWGVLIFNLIACSNATATLTAVTRTPTAVTLLPPATTTPILLPRQATASPTTLLPSANPSTIPTLSQSLSSTLPLTNIPLGIDSLLPTNDPTGKLSFRLAMLATPDIYNLDIETQAQRIGVPKSGAGSLIRNQQGEVLVYIRPANIPGTSIDNLNDVGATITHKAEGYGIVTAFIAPNRLTDLAQLDVVQSVQEVLSP